jgi:hypothetical protein
MCSGGIPLFSKIIELIDMKYSTLDECPKCKHTYFFHHPNGRECSNCGTVISKRAIFNQQDLLYQKLLLKIALDTYKSKSKALEVIQSLLVKFKMPDLNQLNAREAYIIITQILIKRKCIHKLPQAPSL